MDAFDLRILTALQRDGRISNQALAEKVGLSPSPCLRRVQKLQADGVIRGFAAEVDRREVGLSVMAFVHVSLENHHPETLERFRTVIEATDEILECHSLSGRYDYLLKMVARDVEHFDELLTGRLLAGQGVNAANTSFVLRELKQTSNLPLNAIEPRS